MSEHGSTFPPATGKPTAPARVLNGSAADIGLAGPATPATLIKFALRYGSGNSMRAVRSQIGRFGRLLTDTGPDEVMRGLQSAPEAATAAIAGFHLFPFGGLRKSAEWLRSYRQAMQRSASGAGAQNP